MKTLTLLRHAKSGWDDTVTRDVDRPLNAKGRRAAQVVGRHLARERLRFDMVQASPAVRVQETLAAVAEGYGRSLAAGTDRRLYLPSAASLLDIVHELPDEAESALIVGHNPGLEDLVLLLVPDTGAGLRDDVEVKFPTASLAMLEMDVDRWADVAAGAARLSRFVRPRDLDPSLGPDDERH